MSGLNSEGSSQRSASVEDYEDPNRNEERTTSSLGHDPLIYTEVFDDKSEPTHAEVQEYAHRLGIDVNTEPQLLDIAKQGLLTELPPHWKPCWDETKDDFYYFNFESGHSQWEHPLDAIFLEKVTEARGQKRLKDSKEFLDPDITEVSGDTSDLLSAEVNKEDQDQFNMDLNAPQKLAPLPPLGRQLAPLGMGKKTLPPVNTLGPPPGGGVPLGSTPLSEKKKVTSIHHLSKPLTRPVLGGLKVNHDPPGLASPTQSLGATHKRQSLIKSSNVNHALPGDSSPENSSQVSSTSGPIRGILKGTTASSSSPAKEERKLYRDSLTQADKKRIHFNAKTDVKELTFEPESTSTSSEVSIEKVISKPTPRFQPPKPIPKLESLPSEDSHEDKDKDFMVEKSHASGPASNGSRPKTKLSKILSSVSNPDEEDKIPENSVSAPSKPNPKQDSSSTLSNVKLGTTTMQSLDQAKKPDNPRSFHSESARIAPSVAPKKQEDVRDIEKDVQDEVASFKERISSNLAIEKTKIEAELRAAYQDEIQQIRENLQTERQRQEENLKDVFAFEMQKLRETLESNLEIQRTEMMRNFNDEMDRDSRKMDGERQSQYREKEEELRQSVENQLEHYRTKLKEEVEQQRVLIEKEFKERLLHNMEKARQEVISEIKVREAKEIHTQIAISHPEVPISTNDSKAEFINEIRNLEDEIRELKLHIKQQEQRKPIDDPRENNDSSDDGIEDVPKRRHKNEDRASHRSRRVRPVESDSDSFYESSQLDLNKSLQNLKRRVNSLEKSMNPFSVPYQVPTVIKYSLSGSQFGAVVPANVPTSALSGYGTNSNRITTSSTGWTVDEQIYKSKLWLKHRNQSRIPKS
ncbi:centrosomal protein of 164 kDa-like isoform X2 [Tigriopus californicus]|uniref:centrosomal protein of 164 kDa-like isoform X2 n=1 Tax=Tigriopus californicus TaxID=6832 RepID=UPI0027DA6BC8|nr:centrosomal protein of 164 kDa-like isoform X2 [Tigriopus californicus]